MGICCAESKNNKCRSNEMRLHEVAMVDAPHFKGMPKSQEIVPPSAFELRTKAQRDNIEGWQKIYDKLPDKETAYAYQVKYYQLIL